MVDTRILAAAFGVATVAIWLCLRLRRKARGDRPSRMILLDGVPPIEVKWGCQRHLADAYAQQIARACRELWPCLSRAYSGVARPIPIDTIEIHPREWRVGDQWVIGETLYTWPLLRVRVALPGGWIDDAAGLHSFAPDPFPWELRNVARVDAVRAGAGEFDPVPGDEAAAQCLKNWRP